jgi:hypothetical protein
MQGAVARYLRGRAPPPSAVVGVVHDELHKEDVSTVASALLTVLC